MNWYDTHLAALLPALGHFNDIDIDSITNEILQADMYIVKGTQADWGQMQAFWQRLCTFWIYTMTLCSAHMCI